MKILQRGNNDRWVENTLFYAFIIVYTGVMLYLCHELNIWMDEAYTLDTTSRKYTLSQVISQSYNFESQPPVYFILLSFWRKINDGVTFSRLFSLGSIAVAAWYFNKVVILISGIKASRWLLVLFLLNPFVIWAGLEIRLYAFLLLLSILLIYFFFKYYTEQKNKYLFIFLFISAVGLYTQYFFAFLIGALVLSAWVFKGWKMFFKMALYLIPVLLLFLPNIMYMSDQLGMVQSQKLEYTIPQRIGMVLHSPQNLMLSMGKLPFTRDIRRLLLLTFVVLLGYAYFRFYKKSKNNKTFYNEAINLSIFAALVLITMLAIFITITSIDHEDRYLTIALPLFILTFTLFQRSFPFGGSITYGLLVLFFLGLFIYENKNPVKQYDYKAVAKYVKDKQREGEPILFYHSTISLPFSHYYSGHNTFGPLPHKVYFDTTYMNNIKDTAELFESIENVKSTSRSYLLISDLNEAMYNGNENRKMVNDYLSTHYSITLDTLYFGLSANRPLRIRRLEEK